MKPNSSARGFGWRLTVAGVAALAVGALGVVAYYFCVGALGWHPGLFYVGWIACSAFEAARREFGDA